MTPGRLAARDAPPQRRRRHEPVVREDHVLADELAHGQRRRGRRRPRARLRARGVLAPDRALHGREEQRGNTAEIWLTTRPYVLHHQGCARSPSSSSLAAIALATPAPAAAAAPAAPRRARALLQRHRPARPLAATVPGAIRIRAARIRSRRADAPAAHRAHGRPGPGRRHLRVELRLHPADRRARPRRARPARHRRVGPAALPQPRAAHLDGRSRARPGACGRSLGARRSFYTSADSADDIEALRIRLDVPRIALYAVSYGTRVAIEYARRYPERVERMILDSPVGIDAPDSLARETLERRPAGRCARSAASGCGGAQAHPVADLARLVHAAAPLADPPRRAPRRPARAGLRRRRRPPRPARLQRPRPVVHAADPAGGAGGASRGNSAPLVRLKARSTATATGGGPRERVSEFSPAVYAATTCEDATFAWDPAAGPETRRSQARCRRSTRSPRRSSRRSTAARR